MLTRRRTVALVAAAMSAGPAASAKPNAPIIVNSLGNLWDPNISMGEKAAIRPGGRILEVDDRVIADAKAARLSAINITVGYASGSDDPYQSTAASLDRWDALIAANASDLLKVARPSDFHRASAEGKIGLIYGFQNSIQVGEHLDRVDEYARRGVRVIQLTYNDINMMGGGSAGPENVPLSPLGVKLVQRLNQAKIMVDLSHSGRQTCLDALAVSEAPISINHTGCRALADLPRNKTDEELRGVAEKGGYVGIFFMPYLALDGRPRASDAADHIVHALKVCGEDHVGIGTDGTPTPIDDLKAFRVMMAKDYQARVSAGVATKGESVDNYPFLIELTGPDQYRTIVRLLRKRGLSSRVIEKVLGLNFINYAKRVWA